MAIKTMFFRISDLLRYNDLNVFFSLQHRKQKINHIFHQLKNKMGLDQLELPVNVPL